MQSSLENTIERHSTLRTVIAIFTALTVVMVLAMARGLNHYPPKISFHSGQIDRPVLALELARDRGDLIEVLQTDNPAQSVKDTQRSGSAVERNAVCALMVNTDEDCIFILFYAGALAGLALLFTATPKRLILRCIAVGVVVLEALLDYAENYGMFKSLTAQSLSNELAQHISYPSRVKWAFLGMILLLLAETIRGSQLPEFRPWVRWILSAAFVIAGLLLFVALKYVWLFTLATSCFALLLLISAAGLMGPFFKRENREKIMA